MKKIFSAATLTLQALIIRLFATSHSAVLAKKAEPEIF